MLQTITSGTPTIYLSYDLLLCFLMICYLVKLVPCDVVHSQKRPPEVPCRGTAGKTRAHPPVEISHSITA